METLKYWTIEDFEVSTNEPDFKIRKNKSASSYGPDAGNCIYTFNEYGFRSDSFNKKGIRIMSVGGSHTEGVNVHNHHTWPHLLCNKIYNAVNINIAIQGRSNDYMSRAILTWTDTVKPSLVLVMYTYPYMREYFTKNNEIESFHPTIPWGYFDKNLDGRRNWYNLSESINENENFVNWYKNHQLITYYLKSKKIPFIWNGTFLNFDYTDENRFDGNYPKLEDNLTFANGDQHEDYATELFKHIKEKFEI